MSVKLPPLPEPSGRWADDPAHPRSTPGDPVKTYSGKHTDDAMHAYGEACARAALEAAAWRCLEIPDPSSTSYCADAIRALEIER